MAGAAIAAKYVRKFLRSPMEWMSALLFPLIILALFGVIMARFVDALAAGGPGGVASGVAELGYLSFMMPGALALTALTASMLGGSSLLNERFRGGLKSYLAAPIPRSSILVGVAASGVAKAFLQSVVLWLCALALGVRLNPGAGGLVGTGAVLVAFLAFAIGFVGVAVAFAARAPSVEAYHSVLMVLNIPVLFLSNALYPIEVLPVGLRAVALANPTSYLIDAFRVGLFQVAPMFEGWSLYADVTVLAAFALAGSVWAMRAFRRMEA